jgi:RHS repeat-associated protein
LPFGEDFAESGTQQKQHLTSYERDAESGLDYAVNRYHNSSLGRFGSVDPVMGNTADPQSLNRYAYTRNDPINLVDPDGQLLASPIISYDFLAALFGPHESFDVFGGGGGGFIDPIAPDRGLFQPFPSRNQSSPNPPMFPPIAPPPVPQQPIGIGGGVPVPPLLEPPPPTPPTTFLGDIRPSVSIDVPRSQRSSQGELRECGTFNLKITLRNVGQGNPQGIFISDVVPGLYNPLGIRQIGEASYEQKGDRLIYRATFQVGNIVSLSGGTTNIGLIFRIGGRASSGDVITLGNIDVPRLGHDGDYLEVRDTVPSSNRNDPFKNCP